MNSYFLLLVTSATGGGTPSPVAIAIDARENMASPSEEDRRDKDGVPAPDDIVVTGLRNDDGQHRVTANGALGAKTLLDTPYSLTVVIVED